MCPTEVRSSTVLKRLPKRWEDFLATQPETAMEGQTGDVVLKDGRVIEDVAFLGCRFVSEVRGHADIPFDPEEIVEIRITNKRWTFQ